MTATSTQSTAFLILGWALISCGLALAVLLALDWWKARRRDAR